MFKRLLLIMGVLVSLGISICGSIFVLAASPSDELQKFSAGQGGSTNPGIGYDTAKTASAYTSDLIKIFLQVICVLLLVVMLYAGFLYVTAGGKEKQVEQAQGWLLNSVIGMVIISSAYVITNAVFSGSLVTFSTQGTVDVATGAGFTGGDTLSDRIIVYMNIFLQIVGVILLIVTIYAGFLWLTAGGNEKQVEKAQEWIKNAVIGMAIVGAAYLLVQFIVQSVF